MTLRHDAKVLLGNLASATLPQLARDIDENRNGDRWTFLKKAMIEARIVRARRRADHAALAGTFRRYWTSAAARSYHLNFLEERHRLFRDHHAEILERLVEVVERHPDRLARFVEIGCGDGWLLDQFAARLAEIDRFVGVDLNDAVIAADIRAPGRDPRIDFVCADALDWFRANRQPGTVLFTYNGVLEYFSAPQLAELMRLIAGSGPAAIALVEPIAPEHDLEHMQDSFAFGHESTFSHNHRHRLVEAGFDIAFQKVLVADGIRWMMMVATAGLRGDAPAAEMPEGRRGTEAEGA